MISGPKKLPREISIVFSPFLALALRPYVNQLCPVAPYVSVPPN